jgi:hypothetical protein
MQQINNKLMNISQNPVTYYTSVKQKLFDGSPKYTVIAGNMGEHQSGPGSGHNCRIAR